MVEALPVALKFTRRATLAGALALLATGCQDAGEIDASNLHITAELQARMAPTGGSAATGSVRFTPIKGGVAMTAHILGLTDGFPYRLAIHSNGNCSSPNGFSAGPLWIPSGKTEPVLSDNNSGYAASGGSLTLVTRLYGVELDGPNSVFGKSVVLHQGTTGSMEAKPGVPNDRVACGVVGPVDSLF